jgi:hypothetical protein
VQFSHTQMEWVEYPTLPNVEVRRILFKSKTLGNSSSWSNWRQWHFQENCQKSGDWSPGGHRTWFSSGLASVGCHWFSQSQNFLGAYEGGIMRHLGAPVLMLTRGMCEAHHHPRKGQGNSGHWIGLCSPNLLLGLERNENDSRMNLESSFCTFSSWWYWVLNTGLHSW